MQELKDEILASMEADPDDYDGREALWMEREDLRAEPAPRFRRVEQDMISVGAMLIVLCHHTI